MNEGASRLNKGSMVSFPIVPTLCQPAEALQHAYGGARSVAPAALPLQLVVAAQDGVGLLRHPRLQAFDEAEIRLHLLHGPQGGGFSRHTWEKTEALTKTKNKAPTHLHLFL